MGSSAFTVAFASYYAFIYPSPVSIVAGTISAFAGFANSYSSLSYAAYVYLKDDGETIVLNCYNFVGKVKDNQITLPISEIETFKGKDGFRIKHKGKNYYLSSLGRYEDPDLLIAVLRGLKVDSSQFTKSN